MLSLLRRRIDRWSAAEFAALAALAVAAAALFGFFALVDEVIEGETHAFDEAVLRALRNPADSQDPVGPWWIEVMVRDLTALGSTTVLALITVAVVGYLLIDGKRATALFVIVSVCGGALASALLKQAFARPRPELVAHLVDVHTLSFPSGHAMMSATTFLTLGALLARVQTRPALKAYLLGLAVVLTVLVGASRIYLGVHWPTDVLAGWCAGAAWAMICLAVMLWLQRRGQVETPDDSVAPPR
ncbi:MAG: phosphatase PAP2 family protein [Xanthobacteraceae bacterium]